MVHEKEVKAIDYKNISNQFTERFQFEYNPVGLYFSTSLPEKHISVGKNGNGCIAPLILQSAKGKTVVFYNDHFGWPCSAYYLGYTDWIFPGIENYLSVVDIPNRGCEKFIKTPDLAREYIQSLNLEPKSEGFAIYKPLAEFTKDEHPEVIIFFCNPDQISGLTFLTYFDNPLSSDRIVTMFSSSCASVAAIPLKMSRTGEMKAICGFHDISARARHSKNILSMAFTPKLFEEMVKNMKESFLYAEQWDKIRDRNKIENNNG
jgi:uncharacterized protein (DUF169 family)